MLGRQRGIALIKGSVIAAAGPQEMAGRTWSVLGQRFYFAGGSFSFSITSFRLKLAAFCRCGNSLNDVRNSPT